MIYLMYKHIKVLSLQKLVSCSFTIFLLISLAICHFYLSFQGTNFYFHRFFWNVCPFPILLIFHSYLGYFHTSTYFGFNLIFYFKFVSLMPLFIPYIVYRPFSFFSWPIAPDICFLRNSILFVSFFICLFSISLISAWSLLSSSFYCLWI